MAENTARTRRVYIGTYTKRGLLPPGLTKWTYQGRGEGIYLYQLDLETGALTWQQTFGGVVNPSYMAFHPGRPLLYTVNQAVQLEDTDYPGGAVSAFAIDPATGDLTFLNRQRAYGGGTCYITVDQTGQSVLVSNYRSGTAAILPIEADGRLGAATDWVQHAGSGINPQRQEGPHAHSINLDPPNRHAYVPDLGIDKIMIYQVDLAEGKLIPNEPPYAQLHPGAGPRHFAFHPNQRYAYGINELDSTMTAFAYNEANGSLTEIQTISTLPAGFAGTSACADVHVHPNGRFLYGSNRGHDSIVIYEIEATTGRLALIGHESTRGEHPRNFSLDPTGTFLLAANMNTDNVVVFRIDQASGQLTPTGHEAEVPSPVCVKFMPLSA